MTEMILPGGWYCLITETTDELYHRWLTRKVRENGSSVEAITVQGLPLEVSIHNRDEEIIAGLVGYSRGSLFIIALAWLDKHYQHSDLARQLAMVTEAEAMRRGCRQSYVQTSAVEFYSYLGYHTVQTAPNIIALTTHKRHQNMVTLCKELA